MPKTIREYMIKNRKIRDKNLFFFKSNELFEPYSSKCGAVDMRQPLAITNLDIQNMKLDKSTNNITNKAFESMEKDILKWGTDSSKINNYLCARIWCIKDNIIITPLQLLDNDGKCPICNGRIIDNKLKTIGEGTVLLRKGKSNNYWGEKTLPNDFIEDVKNTKFKSSNTITQNQAILKEYKEKWNIYLKGIEKLAYPSFLDPKSHPQGLCMICCNANKSKVNNTSKLKVTRNFEKCLLHYVDDFSYDFDIENELKPGIKLNKNLKLKDQIVLIDKKLKLIKVKEITSNGSIDLFKFTNLNIDFIEGITIVIYDKKEKYFTLYNKKDNIYNFEVPDKKAEISYVLGTDKFPLPNRKYGVLPEKIDIMLNGSNTNNIIKKGEIINKIVLATKKEISVYQTNPDLFNKNYGVWVNNKKKKLGDEYAKNANLYFRIGNEQNYNNSFLLSVYNSKNNKITSLNDIFKIIIKNLTPQIFIELNCGDIFKFFIPTHLEYEYIKTSIIKNIKHWCSKEKEFVKFLGCENILTMSIDNIKNIFLNKNNNFYILKQLFDIYFSYENFKRYICDMNIEKDYKLLIDLVSRSEIYRESFNINIFILESSIEGDKEKLSLLCPKNYDIKNNYNEKNKNILLLKKRNYFENIVFTSKSYEMKFPPIDIHYIVKQGLIETFFKLLKINCGKNELSSYDLINISELEITKKLVDKYYKGIGLVTKSNIIIYTQSFNFGSFDIPYINLKNIPRKSNEELLKNYEKINSILFKNKNNMININSITYTKDFNDNIHGIMIDDNYVPIKIEKINNKYESKNIVNFDYDENIDNALYGSNKIKDERIEQVNKFMNELNLYIQFKKYLNNYFQDNIELKNKIKYIVSNGVIPTKDKRQILSNFFKDFLKNIVKKIKNTNVDKCYNIENVKCKKKKRLHLFTKIRNIF